MRSPLATGLLLVLAVPGLPAQARPAAGYDSLARVVVLSLPDELRRRSAQAAAEEQAGLQQLEQARREEQRLQPVIDTRKLELKALEKRLDLAKKEKRESDRKTLEEERKALEFRLRMLERWKDVHSLTIRVAELTRAASVEYRKAAEEELKLLDLGRAAEGSAEADSAVREFRMRQQEENLIAQTRRLLEARRSEAELRRQLADRQRELADKQLALIEAQLAVRSVKQ